MLVEILKSDIDKDRIDLIIKPETKFEEDILSKYKYEIAKQKLKFSIYAENKDDNLKLTTNLGEQ